MKSKLVMAVAALAIIAAAVIVPNVMATGNGAPSGTHYNLNLIGKDKTDILPNDDNSGHRIFVNLEGKSKILLSEGEFAVLDADATDGSAKFQLPAPENTYVTDPVTGEVTDFVPGAYTVWIRPVGKPGGSATMSTCATYTYTDPITLEVISEEVCSMDASGPVVVTLERNKGKSTFEDVTRELTTVTYYDVILGRYVTVDIFDEALEGYFWDYDNNGMKIVQLRFYPTS